MSMNPVQPPAEVEREPMRWQMKVGLAVTAVGVFFVLFAWLEHERAKAVVAAYRHQLTTGGERLDLKDHLPSPPKPEENAAPELLAAIASLPESPWENQPELMALTSIGRARVAWRQAELPNAKHEDVWPFVIASVETHRSNLVAAARALERPHWHVSHDYARLWKLDLKHLTQLRRLAIEQRNAVLLGLHQEQPSAAHVHLLALARLVQRLGEEPLHITQLTRYSLAALAVPPTWEALRHPSFTETQMAELQAVWDNAQVWKPFVAATDLERSAMASEFQRLRENAEEFQSLAHGARTKSWPVPSPLPSLWDEFWEELFRDPAKAVDLSRHMWRCALWPTWNSYHDERHALTTQQHWLDFDRAALRTPNTFPAMQRIEDTAKREPAAPEGYFVTGDWSMKPLRVRMAHFEAIRRMLVTAIALERHRLRHGSYPVTLAALVPALLPAMPVDFLDAKPLRYRRDPDGTFFLWSVGENGLDDGGPVLPPPGVVSSRSLHWLRTQDIVWPSPASEAEVTALHARYATERAAKSPP